MHLPSVNLGFGTVAQRKLSPRVNAKDPPPLWELGADAFEELCCDLLANEPGISRCELFGKRGERQLGIDLKAWREDNSGIEVAQCKAQQRFTPAEIRDAAEMFLDHWNYWHKQAVQRFILIVACDLHSRKCHEVIESQEELFRQRGVLFEAWSNRILVNKLAPHPPIVARRFVERPDYWVRKICGREMQQYEPVATPAGARFSVLPGIIPLAHRISESIRSELEVVRDLARRGKSGEAQRRLQVLAADHSTWPFVDPAVHALALRLETGLALERGELSAARMSLHKLEALGVPDGLGVLRAAIVHREEGPEKALEVLGKQPDPEARRLEAALFLETGEFTKAIERLETSGDGRSDAEILRLRAEAHLSLGEVERAFSCAQTALDYQPEWLSVRIAFTMVGYFTSLSPAALPEHAMAWPQPVSWALVRRDDESSERRWRAAEIALKILKEADLDGEARRLLETFHLACLACESERREEAEYFCQELVRRDRLHVPAIAWALGRGFRLDLDKSRKALQQLFNAGRTDLNQIIALVACHLRDNRRHQAVKILRRARPAFEKEGQIGLWFVQAAQMPSGETAQGKARKASMAPKIAEAGQVGMLVEILNAEGEQDNQELSRLAKVALEQRHLTAFVEACEALARCGQWHLLAPFAHELIEVIGTGDTARIAALITFNQGFYEECLEILKQAEPLFPERRLAPDLRRLRVQTLQRLGRSPEAIALAEQGAREGQEAQDLLSLVNLYWAKGDLPAAAFHARSLGARSDLSPQEGLRTAARIASADPYIARDLFRQAVQAGVPNELLPATIYLAQRLGDSAGVQPLVARLDEFASPDANGPFRRLTQADLRDLQRYAAQEAARLENAYLQGVLPVHALVGPLDLSLAWLLAPLRRSEKKDNSELQHPTIFLCHGGRRAPSPSELPPSPKEWHLYLDTTALLVADALEVLPLVEQLFAPLSVPQNLPVALIHIEELEELQRHSVAAVSLSEAEAALGEKARQERMEWIRKIRANISHGIDRGTYRFLPEPAEFRAYVQSSQEKLPPEQFTLTELLLLAPAPGNCIWIDDRLVTTFLRAPGGFIVGITDLLVALEAYGGITRKQRFEKLHQLRSAGARYFPLSLEELLYHLRSAPVEEGRLVETHELRTLRRYFASCFANAELIQRPPVPDVIRNSDGEIWFLNSFEEAILDALVRIFQDEVATREECWAQADYVWNNLRVEDLPSLVQPNRCEADWLSWLGLQFSKLLVRSALWSIEKAPAAGQDLLTWLEHRVLPTSQRANPGLDKEILRFLKELVFYTAQERAAKKRPQKSLRAVKGQLVHRMPERIRDLLLADKEVLTALGDVVEPITGSNGLTFSARKLWSAVEAASRGKEIRISTWDGSRRFIVRWVKQVAESHELYLEEYPQGIRAHIADPLLGLVSRDVAERRALLAQNRAWLDHGEPEQSTWIDQVALQPELWCRVEMVVVARKDSAAWYYRKFADTARKTNIDISELLPPSLNSLLRYQRLDRNLAAIDFSAALDQGARRLLVEEGLAEAIRRLAGLPVPLPNFLLDALSDLDIESREEILQCVLGGPGSPVAIFHLVRAHLHLLGKAPVSSEIFASLVEPLWETTLLGWAEAFVTLLRWVDRRFELWEETLSAPAPLRLAMTWSHAHQLARAFAGIGVQPEGLRGAFSASNAEDALRSSILYPNLSYLDDVAHPDRIEPESLLFHGALFALGDQLPRGLTTSGQDWWLRLTTKEVEEGRVLRLPFLQAYGCAGNLLSSFLSWEQWQHLAGLFTAPEPWFPPHEDFFREKIRETLEQLGADPSDFDQWALLSGLVGTLGPPQDAADDLASRLSEFDFAELYRRAPREAPAILSWVAQIASRLTMPAVSERIGTQALAAAEIFRKEKSKPPGFSVNAEAPEVLWGSFLLLAFRWTALTRGDSVGSAEKFASLVGRLVDTWPESTPFIFQAVERLSSVVPLGHALQLRPLLLRLRASLSSTS